MWYWRIFQLTHPWGCDAFPAYGRKFRRFQLTHPWGCDLLTLKQGKLKISFQLTHPWGCDLRRSRFRRRAGISTHTPVRVWLKVEFTYNPLPISTHTPVRVWLWPNSPLFLSTNFNSHTREGVTASVNFSAGQKNFNSHTREGVTGNSTSSTAPRVKFQLTHPWGCD